MATTPMPMRNARLIALSLSWCFAVIAASVGLNSLIKSNQSQSRLKKLATPPTVVSINVHGSSLFSLSPSLDANPPSYLRHIRRWRPSNNSINTNLSTHMQLHHSPLPSSSLFFSIVLRQTPCTINKNPPHPSILPFLLLHRPFGSNDPIHAVLRYARGRRSRVRGDAGVA